MWKDICEFSCFFPSLSVELIKNKGMLTIMLVWGLWGFILVWVCFFFSLDLLSQKSDKAM